LGNIYALLLSYEKGEWSDVSFYADRCNIQEEEVPELYLESLQWIRVFLKETSSQ